LEERAARSGGTEWSLRGSGKAFIDAFDSELVFTAGRPNLMLSGGGAATLVRRAQMSSEELDWYGEFSGRGTWQDCFLSVASDPNDIPWVKAKILRNLREGHAKKQCDALMSVKPRKPWWEYLGLSREDLPLADMEEPAAVLGANCRAALVTSR